MRTLSSALAVCITLACGYAMIPTADAATSAAWSINNGSACQLSIPTTNTGVRPKATGFRNESLSTSNFVICPISSPITPQGGAMFDHLYIFLQTLDGGTNVSVTCTAVVGGDQFTPSGPIYSTKTFKFIPLVLSLAWDASDFGGTAGAVIPGSGLASITCNLPPQVSIQHTEAHFVYQIGT